MPRRAFTFLPLVVLLGISLAVVGIIAALNTPPKVTGNAAYDQGNRFGSIAGPAIIALFFIWLASRVAERRSAAMANGIFGSILLLMNIAYGVNLYRVLNGIPQPKAAQRARNPFTPAPPATTPAPSAPPSNPSTPANPGNSAPVQSPALPAPPPPPPPGPSPHEIAEQQADAKAKPIIEAFKAKLIDDIKGPADAAEGFAKDIAKPPAHDKRVLKERTANADALRKALVKLESDLKAAGDNLEKELTAAGLDPFDARHRSMRFDADFSATTRAFAAGRLISLCDRVKNECAALDQDFAAWTLTKGELTVKDIKKRHALTTERFFIESDVNQLPSTLTTLREGR